VQRRRSTCDMQDRIRFIQISIHCLDGLHGRQNQYLDLSTCGLITPDVRCQDVCSFEGLLEHAARASKYPPQSVFESGYILRVSTASPPVTFSMARLARLARFGSISDSLR